MPPSPYTQPQTTHNTNTRTTAHPPPRNQTLTHTQHKIIKTGPRGTLKMLVGGAGQIKITKVGPLVHSVCIILYLSIHVHTCSYIYLFIHPSAIPQHPHTPTHHDQPKAPNEQNHNSPPHHTHPTRPSPHNRSIENKALTPPPPTHTHQQTNKSNPTTKQDGQVLLHEMQIQHPTAALIARTATAQDDITVRFLYVCICGICNIYI